MNGLASHASPRVDEFFCADCGQEFTPDCLQRTEIMDGATPLCSECAPELCECCGEPKEPNQRDCYRCAS